jgi:hypothetical protein
MSLFGLDECFEPEVKTATRVFRFPSPEKMIRVDTRDASILMTPDHPCFVLDGDSATIKRADELGIGDPLPVLSPLYDNRHDGQTPARAVVKSTRCARPSGDHVYCVSVDEPLHGFALANGIVTHNCFGYTGYKNARFGKIECHEAINAYGRELMLQASEIAEAHGFEILHGIVDSLWLKGNGDPSKFCEHVSGHTGIPLEPEGIYKWIAFLPDKSHGVGVLNRYYGLFENGEFKLRGIELRRRDTADIVRDMQNDILKRLAKAEDAKGVIELVPEALEVIDRYAETVISGTVPLDKLVVTRRVSRALEEYKQLNDAVAALHQLDAEGIEVNPGENVRYVITSAKSKDLSRRVRAEPLLSDEGYDPEAYVDLLLRAAETILMPMGWDRETLYENMRRNGLRYVNFEACPREGVSNEKDYIG